MLIPPWPYYQGCTFDQCHMPGTDVVCSALELYAALCASLGVCIDWRGQTNYTCRACPPPPSLWAVAFKGMGAVCNQWVGLGGQGGLLGGGGGLGPGWRAFVSRETRGGIQVSAPGPGVQGSGLHQQSLARGPGQGPWLVPCGLRRILALHTAFACPAGMEYRPCGPPSPSYCYMNSSASPL